MLLIRVTNTTALLCSGYYHPRLTEEKTDTLKSEGMCPEPHPHQVGSTSSQSGWAPPCLCSETQSPLQALP